jgi:hypothetical protein
LGTATMRFHGALMVMIKVAPTTNSTISVPLASL